MRALVITQEKSTLKYYKRILQEYKIDTIGLGEGFNHVEIVFIDIIEESKKNLWYYTSFKQKELIKNCFVFALINQPKKDLIIQLEKVGVDQVLEPRLGLEKTIEIIKSKINFIQLNKQDFIELDISGELKEINEAGAFLDLPIKFDIGEKINLKLNSYNQLGLTELNVYITRSRIIDGMGKIMGSFQGLKPRKMEMIKKKKVSL